MIGKWTQDKYLKSMFVQYSRHWLPVAIEHLESGQSELQYVKYKIKYTLDFKDIVPKKKKPGKKVH